MEDEEEIIDRTSPFQAFICPNAGAAANLSSRRQRVIFVPIDRNDVYSILDVGKIADLILMVMSCKETDSSKITNNPDQYSGAIDELGYKALALLR